MVNIDFTKMTPARQAKIEAAPAKALPPICVTLPGRAMLPKLGH